ncbi:unnamed protein product [Caenorhabditis auriculariae]|uniref:Uncharacterized protein n=1 Tax=Caenorhabditis auriculariae TaxID=2777116 RepID=A0A8S1H097_9PELO|nr:unnamed protein product [Caenorhabditis auriculariae]
MTPSSSVLFVLLIIPTAWALRCHDYTRTNNFKSAMKTWVDCPIETQFCYKSYLEQRDFNNDKTWVEGRACGTAQLCVRDGCVGNNNDKACCCTKDLCNSARSSTIIAALSSLLLFIYAKF